MDSYNHDTVKDVGKALLASIRRADRECVKSGRRSTVDIVRRLRDAKVC